MSADAQDTTAEWIEGLPEEVRGSRHLPEVLARHDQSPIDDVGALAAVVTGEVLAWEMQDRRRGR